MVLLDVQLPDTDGFAVASLLTQARDWPRVVLCSVRGAEDYDGKIDRCGAAGFLTKSELSAYAIRKLVAIKPPASSCVLMGMQQWTASAFKMHADHRVPVGRLDGLRREVGLVADSLVGVSFGHQRQDLAFSVGSAR